MAINDYRRQKETTTRKNEIKDEITTGKRETIKHLWETIIDIFGKKTVIFFLFTAPLFFMAAFIDFGLIGGFSFVGILILLIYLARREWDYFTGKRTRPEKEEVHKVYIVYRKKKNWWDL